ncbi:MAG: pyridoxamine 5'-phosphate oxidase family protein [Bacilli bacterium]
MKTESAIERAIRSVQKIVANECPPMSELEGREQAVELLKRSEIAMVGSLGEAGYPNIKAMFKIESDSLFRVWFSTNTSSRRVGQFKRDPRASVYFHDPERVAGLLLVGDIEVVSDLGSKRDLWRDGWEAYYPRGVTDPEYCVLRFFPHIGNYYHELQNIDFQICEIDKSLGEV